MALARLNVPGLIVSGGSIGPGKHARADGTVRETTILDVYDCQAKAQQGAMSEEDAMAVIRTACPGAGGCGINASFNTWAVACEAMGISACRTPPRTRPSPRRRKPSAGPSAASIANLLREDLRPRDVLTKPALENGMRSLCASGGSTNGVLHLLALAAEAGVDFAPCTTCSASAGRPPCWPRSPPAGPKTMLDLHRLGGTPVLLKHLLNHGLLDGSCITVTGNTLAENHADVTVPDVGPDQFLRDPSAPLNAAADLQICFGNLAPGGVVFKVSSLKEPRFRGRALVLRGGEGRGGRRRGGQSRPRHGGGAAGAGPGGGGDAGGAGRQRGPPRRSWTGGWPFCPTRG